MQLNITIQLTVNGKQRKLGQKNIGLVQSKVHIMVIKIKGTEFLLQTFIPNLATQCRAALYKG